MQFRTRPEFRVPMMEFQVVGIEPQGNLIRVVGRCINGPMVLGNRFSSITPSGRAPVVVDLRVERIRVYGHEVGRLYEGLSAAIDLSGDLVSLVTTGCMLTGEAGYAPD